MKQTLFTFMFIISLVLMTACGGSPVDKAVDQSHPTHYLGLRRLPEGEQGELRPCDADHDDNRFGLVVADVLRRTDAVR